MPGCCGLLASRGRDRLLPPRRKGVVARVVSRHVHCGWTPGRGLRHDRRWRRRTGPGRRGGCRTLARPGGGKAAGEVGIALVRPGTAAHAKRSGDLLPGRTARPCRVDRGQLGALEIGGGRPYPDERVQRRGHVRQRPRGWAEDRRGHDVRTSLHVHYWWTSLDHTLPGPARPPSVDTSSRPTANGPHRARGTLTPHGPS